MERPIHDETRKLLAWIHSNKAITAKHYRLRFKPEFTLQNAGIKLIRLVEKGYLHRSKAFLNSDSFFSLTDRALKELKEGGLVILSPAGREPKVNVFEKEHDNRVVNIRIAFERAKLDHFLWLSDYEMRCGLTLEKKKALARGKAVGLQSRKETAGNKSVPDGYFECRLKNKVWSFLLEYEHKAYSREKITTKFNSLYRGFPEAIKLVVAATPERTAFLKAAFGRFLSDPDDRAAWVFTDYPSLLDREALAAGWTNLDDYQFPLFGQ